jgi:hypothetical protein
VSLVRHHGRIVRQASPRRPKVDERRHLQEVRHTRRLDVGVSLDLAGQVALVVTRTKQQAPSLVRKLAGALRERRQHRIEGADASPEVLERRFERVVVDLVWRLGIRCARMPPR